MASKQDRDELGRRDAVEQRGDRDGVIVTKVSGKDLDSAINRLSMATAPYFRAGGPLMPHKPS